MDSKTIYIMSTSYLKLVAWQIQDGEEWTYIGTGKDIDSEKTIELVQAFVDEEKLLFVTDRHESKVVDKEDLLPSLKTKIEDFLLWDLSFKTVVQFSCIGVARKGYRTE